MIKSKASVVTLSMLGLILVASAHADDDAAEIQAKVQSAGLLSLEEASEKALAAKPGKIVETDLDRRAWPSKGWDYEFEIVDADGHRWEVEIDAKTGAPRKVGRDYF